MNVCCIEIIRVIIMKKKRKKALTAKKYLPRLHHPGSKEKGKI